VPSFAVAAQCDLFPSALSRDAAMEPCGFPDNSASWVDGVATDTAVETLETDGVLAAASMFLLQSSTVVAKAPVPAAVIISDVSAQAALRLFQDGAELGANLSSFAVRQEAAALGLLETVSPRAAAAARSSRVARVAVAATFGVGKALCYFALIGFPILACFLCLGFGVRDFYENGEPKRKTPAWALLSQSRLDQKARMRASNHHMLCPEMATATPKGKANLYSLEGVLSNQPQDGNLFLATNSHEPANAVQVLSFRFMENTGSGIQIFGSLHEAVAFADTSKAFDPANRSISFYRCAADGVRDAKPFAIAERKQVTPGAVRIIISKAPDPSATGFFTEQADVLMIATRPGINAKTVSVASPEGVEVAKLEAGKSEIFHDDADVGDEQRQLALLKMEPGVDPALVMGALIAAHKLA